MALSVPEREISYAQYDHLVENAVEDEYQQYFQYVIETNHVRKPVHWREAYTTGSFRLQDNIQRCLMPIELFKN